MKLKRAIKYWWQRQTRGFDDSETWSLDWTFYIWMLPRLKRYFEVADNVIHIEGEFRQAINDMISGFEAAMQDEETEDSKMKIQLAHEQFAKWHRSLWW